MSDEWKKRRERLPLDFFEDFKRIKKMMPDVMLLELLIAHKKDIPAKSHAPINASRRAFVDLINPIVGDCRGGWDTISGGLEGFGGIAKKALFSPVLDIIALTFLVRSFR